MRYLFICAHPDDLEFNISNVLISISDNPENTVKILSMTRGEYGTYIQELKGEKLGRIREQELRKAAKIEGVTDVEFLGYLDGHVKITQDTIQTVKKVIDNYKPDVIFGPECLYYYYSHKDHVKTGIILYYIVKSMAKEDRPILFMFNSYVNTHYFPMMHIRKQNKAIKVQKSQYWLLMPTYPLRFILGFYFGFRLPRKFRRYILAEAYRKVNFQEDEQRKLGFRQRIIGRIISKFKSLIKPKSNV